MISRQIVLTLSLSARLAFAQGSEHTPKLPCLDPDSGRVAYGSIVTSAQDGDQSGVQFSFAIQQGRLRGWVRDARGQTPPEAALDTLTIGTSGDSLFFGYRTDDTWYIYRARITCKELTGQARLFVTAHSLGKLVPITLHRAEWISKP
jgi:hypothetical protein